MGLGTVPNILRNLKILEVSSVDRGAGEGVKIVLMKKDGVDKVWKSNDDLPASIKSSLPAEAQTVWRKVANRLLEGGTAEESAIKQAWSAVKNGWAKQGDKWVRKAAEPWAASALLDGWADAFDGDVVAYCKREFTAEQRQEAEDKGHAMAGGGFPINTVSDLHNAIQAIGRAKNPAAAKAHIKEQAARLGRSDLIPDTWKRHAPDDIDIEAIKAADQETDMTLDELKKLIGDQINATVGDAVTKAVTEALKVKKATPGGKGRMDSNPNEDHGDMGAEEKDKAEEECDAETKKALAIATLPPEVRKMLDDADKNAKLVQKFVEKQELEEFGKRAVGMGLKKEDGVLLRKAYTGDAASQKVLEERMAAVAKAGKAQEETAIIFKEFGSGNGEGGEAGQSAYDQLEGLAKELRKKDMTLTQAQAFAKVITDPANAELAARERMERMQKIHKHG